MSYAQVALALGSGAARGWSHIGVIKALQDMGVEINMVAGTSIGSLVGAGFASGRLTELEEWVRGMGRWQVFNLLDYGLSNGGIIHGEKVFSHARERFGAIDIEDMPITYGAVATDLYTGREIWLRKGDVYAASRASCAMPGMLAPSAVNGRWLVDGGLVNPVPVSLCRALGADFVIAVNLNSQLNTSAIEARSKYVAPPKDGVEPQADVHGHNTPATTEASHPKPQSEQDEGEGFFNSFLSTSQHYWDAVKEKFTGPSYKAPGMFGVMAGSIDIMQERITKARLAGDPPDILIQPKLGHIGLMQFESGNDAIDIGYETTIRMKDYIMSELELFAQRRG
ncbi:MULTISPECIES: patatin-like phospholipase family protein [Pseudidiomarina]|uniref:NTE family protein n=3 Tax=Pseudidiomarina TaxID=2800384 RepID=A0A368V282_9GAMM|nr:MULTISPECIES: patatin-like phospholipase family protein [Pseudidiomarina]MDX1525167.1 patatin-like phospholipase family protein [Pseudidiomarina maritima]PWW15228.1 NTE family protein [Pseudidiomarina maritima]RBP89652.1 NTE family protein [Pseudidiomarina tainanensis]RCW35202.1 NTE family protein [Pseudidiomarina tainanensis]